MQMNSLNISSYRREIIPSLPRDAVKGPSSDGRDLIMVKVKSPHHPHSSEACRVQACDVVLRQIENG